MAVPSKHKAAYLRGKCVFLPRAMESIEVINSEFRNGSFACKKALGWIVYGATKDQPKQHTVQFHRVNPKANIDQQT